MRRRAVIVAGGVGLFAAGSLGLGLVEAGTLPGRILLHTALGLTGPDGKVPEAAPGRRVTRTFRSRAMGGVDVRWSLAYPPGAGEEAELPVVVFLHGRHENHRYGFDALGLDRFLASAAEHAGASFTVVTVDGGRDTYWHRRRGGADPEAMLWDELLPKLAARGLKVNQVGLYGFSMGGYGALLFAARRPERVSAVVAVAPAIWRAYAETAAGAFDGPSDFRAHNVYRRRGALRNLPLRIDCGHDDPFAPNVKSFVSGLPTRPAGGFQPGTHTIGYLRRMAPAHLRFFAKHL
ncbi:MAG: alpha/beta hydrolase [Micromonosporaceae bacterium]